MARKKKGIWIVVDGIDASGKGTIVFALYGYLLEKGLKKEKVLVTFEPTEGDYGREIRQILKNHEKPESAGQKCLKLYLKDRKEHLKKEILPALKKGKTVICDRFKYSTMAYQNAQGIEMKKIIQKHKGMKAPDLVLILDLPVEMALKRIGQDPKRSLFDKFEKKKFLEKVRINFLTLKDFLPKEKIVIIDASKSKQAVFEAASKEVDKLLF